MCRKAKPLSKLETFIEEAHATGVRVEEHIQTMITWLSHKISNNASATMRRRFDIGATDWRVLAILGIYGPSNGARICEIVGLDKSGVSRSFSILEKKELVRLDRPSERSRTVNAKLSKEGKALFDRAWRLSMAREKILLSGIPPHERKKLFGMLLKILQNVEHLESIDEVPF